MNKLKSWIDNIALYPYIYGKKATLSSMNKLCVIPLRLRFFCHTFMKRGFILLIFIFSASTDILSQTLTVVSEGYIDNDFEGWDGETLFEMSDGTFWIQAAYSYLYYYAYHPKAMVFQHGSQYYLKVENIKETLPVLPIYKIIKSKIDGNFDGFKGDTVYKLMNGTVWQQIDGLYTYKYAYSPEAIVYKIGSKWKMSVKGITVSVVQLR